MPDTKLIIRLSRQEIDYLKNAGFLRAHQINVLNEAVWSNHTSAVLTVSHGLAEEFRDVLTEQLALVGFDENYEVTPAGRILEDLIDRFFPPSTTSHEAQ